MKEFLKQVKENGVGIPSEEKLQAELKALEEAETKDKKKIRGKKVEIRARQTLDVILSRPIRWVKEIGEVASFQDAKTSDGLTEEEQGVSELTQKQQDSLVQNIEDAFSQLFYEYPQSENSYSGGVFFKELRSKYLDLLPKTKQKGGSQFTEDAILCKTRADHALNNIETIVKCLIYDFGRERSRYRPDVEKLFTLCIKVVDRLELYQMEAFITKMESLSTALGKFYEETLKPGKPFALEEFISILGKHFSEKEVRKVQEILEGKENDGWFDLPK